MPMRNLQIRPSSKKRRPGHSEKGPAMIRIPAPIPERNARPLRDFLSTGNLVSRTDKRRPARRTRERLTGHRQRRSAKATLPPSSRKKRQGGRSAHDCAPSPLHNARQTAQSSSPLALPFSESAARKASTSRSRSSSVPAL